MLNNKNYYKGQISETEASIRLDLFLFNYFKHFSRTKIKKYMK